MKETWIKAFMYALYAGLIAFFEFFWFNAYEMFVLTFCMAVDVITWVAKQWRLDKQWITSNRLIVWVVAKLLILLCVLSIALAMKVIWLDMICENYLTVAMVALIWWELYSIISNVHAYRTKEELPEFDAISRFLSWSAQSLKDILDKFIPHK